MEASDDRLFVNFPIQFKIQLLRINIRDFDVSTAAWGISIYEITL